MNTLVIYDNTGFIVSQMSGDVREPIGISFLWVEVLDGKYISGVDVSVIPNVAIFEDYPKSEIKLMQEHQVEAELDIDFRLSMIELGLV